MRTVIQIIGLNEIPVTESCLGVQYSLDSVGFGKYIVRMVDIRKVKELGGLLFLKKNE